MGCFAGLGPLAIDMYLPSFPAIAKQFSATIPQVERTLTAYLFGLAVGAVVLRTGRRSIWPASGPLYVGLVLFVLASVGCAFCLQCAVAADPADRAGDRRVCRDGDRPGDCARSVRRPDGRPRLLFPDAGDGRCPDPRAAGRWIYRQPFRLARGLLGAGRLRWNLLSGGGLSASRIVTARTPAIAFGRRLIATLPPAAVAPHLHRPHTHTQSGVCCIVRLRRWIAGTVHRNISHCPAKIRFIFRSQRVLPHYDVPGERVSRPSGRSAKNIAGGR